MSRPLRIVLALFVWWVLVVAPGVLTVAGVFGKVAEETELGGWVLGRGSSSTSRSWPG